jgi:hypothetical protein
MAGRVGSAWLGREFEGWDEGSESDFVADPPHANAESNVVVAPRKG